MAAAAAAAASETKITINATDTDSTSSDFDYSQRSQWLRAAVLGANDGLVSTSSLMMGVGAVKSDVKAMAAVASAVAFSVGAVVPLLAAAFVVGHRARLGAVGAAASVALVGFGGVGARFGRAPVGVSCVRVLVGGWLAMAVTFGLLRLVGSQTGL
ncbi:hypothetical protein QJS10_CPA02g00451 [Acorus calamus]|uniref:Vacuolar iron transporter n=1 Tax=Acorus calamus TaxID=4465 RepID=A0AAV9FC67_ACOCL|nr:hypothetical protein QJS10_CPA02g00451 [Acorus calamus]